MLYWFKFLLLIFFILSTSFLFTNYSVLYLLLHSEMLIVTFFLICLVLSSIYNINFILGFAFVFLILGGMEIALCLLLLAV